MNIEVKSHELEVIKNFWSWKKCPKIFSPEYLDKSLKIIDIKNFEICNVIESDIYKYLINTNYKMVNWLHSDLIFARKDFID